MDTAPFGTALPPMSGPVGRLRNRALRFVLRRVVFGSHEREADRILTRQLGVPPMQRFIFEWFRAADEFLQFSVPEFEYPRSDLPKTVTFVGAAVPPHPHGFRPPDWWPEVAARVAWTGAGIDVKTGKPTPDAVARAVREVLGTPRYRERARELGRLMERAGDGVDAAADRLVAAGGG